MLPVELEGVLAIVLSLSIPIVAIIFGSIMSIRKKQSETELRRLLIEHNTDIETAKALIEEKEKKSNKYSSLRWACVLIGLGLLVSFFVELKLQDKENRLATPEE